MYKIFLVQTQMYQQGTFTTLDIAIEKAVESQLDTSIIDYNGKLVAAIGPSYCKFF